MVTDAAPFLTTADLASRSDFELGQTVISPSRRSVSGPGGTALVEPRVMQVLTVLAEAKGNVVTRDVLFRRCWGNPYVGDDSLNRAIAGARRIAASVAADSFTIENIPRTGYRLSENGAAGAAVALESEQDAPTISRRTAVAGGLAAVAAIGGLGLWASRDRVPSPVERLMEDSRVAMRSGVAPAEAQAISLLERAVKIEPDNAGAWGLLAMTRARIDEHGGPNTPQTTAAQVEREARRALQLDPGNADAKAALAFAIPYYGDWLAGERRFEAVLKQHPDHVYTRDSLSFMLGAVGRMRESAQLRLRFLSDAPFDANFQFRQIYALWFLDRIEEADRAAERAQQMWPQHTGVWMARLWLMSGTDRLDRALGQIDDPARPKLPPPVIANLRASLLAAQSRDAAAIEDATKGVMTGVSNSVAGVVNAMMLLNLMGSVDAVFALAEAYYLERGPIIAATQWREGQPFVFDQRRRKTNMIFTPMAEPMRRDPRFLPLMKDIGLAEYWNRRGVRPDFLTDART
jgi:DNA-binding winged helix-turn-helix (wHTH) protein